MTLDGRQQMFFFLFLSYWHKYDHCSLQNMPLWTAIQPFFSIREEVKSENGCTVIQSDMLCTMNDHGWKSTLTLVRWRALMTVCCLCCCHCWRCCCSSGSNTGRCQGWHGWRPWSPGVEGLERNEKCWQKSALAFSMIFAILWTMVCQTVVSVREWK